MRKKIKVAVLGVTGSVGQRFVQVIEGHPWFELAAISSSDQRIGQRFGDTCRWVLAEPMPESVRSMEVLEASPSILDVPLVFSALPAGIAKEVEPEFAKAGVVVCTNAGSFRREPDVPILVPEVNPDHVKLLVTQSKKRGWTGYIVTNPNCTSTGMTVALKALQDAFGLESVVAVSLQALSGAGYPGVPSMDIVDNVVPFISNEEEKVEWEPRKILGAIKGSEVVLADFKISAHTNRVSVSDGHLVCLSVKLKEAAAIKDVTRALANFRAPKVTRDLPSAPKPVIVVRSESDRPQPRLDRMEGNGMATIVGRIRPDPIFDIKLIVLSHNTIRGAAGGSLYNAELLVRQGLV